MNESATGIKRPLLKRTTLFGMAIIAGVLLFVIVPGCTIELAGQRVPEYALTAQSDDFEIADDIVALHYYGVGGWGIKWRGQYLLTAPYFSNHGFIGMYGKKGPDIESIQSGVLNTPFDKAGLILVGHGHIDHAADIPGFGAAGLPNNQAGIVASPTTLNMLASLIPPNKSFRCAESPTDDAVPIRDCTLAGFRITPLQSGHAPNVKLLGLQHTVAKGTVDEAMTALPSRPSAYKLGHTWAYLIDLLDDSGAVVFRIHYMDAVAGSDESHIPAELMSERSVDLHIACVPGYHYADDYPEWVIEQGNAGFVLMGHWEHFFHPRNNRLKPVAFVLSENKLEDFAQRIEDAMPADRPTVRPINKTSDNCPSEDERCGPRGETWALPVPGETYHFKP